MSTLTTIGVTGMTCGNCVSHVTQELREVDGVENVSVELRVDAVSDVSVFSDLPLSEESLKNAIDEAGYEVASITVQENAQAAQSIEQHGERGCGCRGADSRPAGPGAEFDKSTGLFSVSVPPRD